MPTPRTFEHLQMPPFANHLKEFIVAILFDFVFVNFSCLINIGYELTGTSVINMLFVLRIRVWKNSNTDALDSKVRR